MWYLWLLIVVLGIHGFKTIQRRKRVSDLHKKHVLITGCDSGFGFLLAKKLDTLGCHVFAACLTEDGKGRLQAETSERVKPIIVDVSRDEDVARALDFVNNSLPQGEGLWGLVNNAGIIGRVLGPPEWYTVNDFKPLFEVNVFGVIRMALTFLPLLKKGKGRLVNTSSMAGRLPGPYAMAYSSAKAVIESFSDAIRPHLALYGVSTHILEPAPFRTDILDCDRIRNSLETGWKQASPEVKDEQGDDYKNRLIDFYVARASNASPDVSLVVDAYVDALTSANPRIRYSVGFASTYVAIPLSYMPSFVQDWVTRRRRRDLIPACFKVT